MAKNAVMAFAVDARERAALTTAARRNGRTPSAEIRDRVFRSRALAEAGEFQEIAEALADDVREEDPELGELLDAVVEHLRAREDEEPASSSYAEKHPHTPLVSERLKTSRGEG